MDRFTNILRPKKINLQDVVAPKPSRTTDKTLRTVLNKAHQDQKATTQKANNIRSK